MNQLWSTIQFFFIAESSRKNVDLMSSKKTWTTLGSSTLNLSEIPFIWKSTFSWRENTKVSSSSSGEAAKNKLVFGRDFLLVLKLDHFSFFSALNGLRFVTISLASFSHLTDHEWWSNPRRPVNHLYKATTDLTRDVLEVDVSPHVKSFMWGQGPSFRCSRGIKLCIFFQARSPNPRRWLRSGSASTRCPTTR